MINGYFYGNNGIRCKCCVDIPLRPSMMAKCNAVLPAMIIKRKTDEITNRSD